MLVYSFSFFHVQILSLASREILALVLLYKGGVDSFVQSILVEVAIACATALYLVCDIVINISLMS